MKIIFFGSSHYCLPICQSLINNFDLIAITTKSGLSVGKFALSHNIKIFTPKDKEELLSLSGQIRQIKPDLAVVADYGLIIPEEIFAIPRYQTLNIHFSKLPKYRGPSPVQYTILTGEKSAWVSVILMDEEIDTGDIIWQKEALKTPGRWPNGLLPGGGSMEEFTTENLYKKLFNLISLELPSIIKKYINNELKPQKQDHSKATYTKHLTRTDGYIPPQTLAAAINRGVESASLERKIRAFTPWPGVWTEIALQGHPLQIASKQPNMKRLKILKAHLDQSTINNQQSTILVLGLVQLEGKKPVSWKQFQEGYPSFSF